MRVGEKPGSVGGVRKPGGVENNLGGHARKIAELVRSFRAGVPGGPINTLEDVFADPQVLARKMRIDLPSRFAKGGSIPGVRSPITVNGVRMSADRAPPTPSPAPRQVQAVKAAECRWAKVPVKVDGVLSELVWDDAQVLTDFAVFWQNRKPKTNTRARLLWDNNYLYFFAEMEDHDLYADVTERNGMTWTNDVFELFFKPAADSLVYYEFQVNAANTHLELFLPARGAGGYQRFAKDTKFGMETAVKLNGTLNNWQDKDKGWVVEGRIPWAAFKPSGGRPEPGAKWRFALCRYDYSVTLDNPELSSTAPLTLEGTADHWNHRVDDDYFSQVGALFRLMTPAQQQVLFENTARSIKGVSRPIQQRHIEHCTAADPAYGAGVAAAIETIENRK